MLDYNHVVIVFVQILQNAEKYSRENQLAFSQDGGRRSGNPHFGSEGGEGEDAGVVTAAGPHDAGGGDPEGRGADCARKKLISRVPLLENDDARSN